jgi:hypothetical protein
MASDFTKAHGYLAEHTFVFDKTNKDEFATALSKTFPQNKGLQKGLLDYAELEGQFVKTPAQRADVARELERRGAPKTKIAIVKARATRQIKTKGEVYYFRNAKGTQKKTTLKKYLGRKRVQNGLKSGKRTVWISAKNHLSTPTNKQAAQYRRLQKHKSPYVDWSEYLAR